MKRKQKRERTNYAPEQAAMDAIERSLSLEDAMGEFLLSKQAERVAERTIRDYKTHFRYFRSWLDVSYSGVRLADMSSKMVKEYISYMSSEKMQYDDHPTRSLRSKPGVVGLSPMTVNVRIRTLRAFFNWCYRDGHIQSNIVQDVKLQKVDNDKIMAFTTEQIKKLLAIPDRSSFSGFRDYVLMMMLLDTGLRIGELLGLSKDDIDFEELVLTVPWDKAKTRKMRSIPFSKKIGKLLAELMQENQDFGANVKKLFYSAYGNELSVNSIDERLHEYGKQAKLEGVRVSAHTFRHTFAVHWIKSGGDPFSLQKILGHTDMSMVRRYVRLTEGDVKVKHRQYSPINLLNK
ncbi:tyrosine-type recombinase/integrase [Tumebacillus avium]|nr:tyrosine-type recombinase/integrase [Tumebacillus avium]